MRALLRGAVLTVTALLVATTGACGGDDRPPPENRQPDVIAPDPPIRWTVSARDLSSTSVTFQDADEKSALVTGTKGVPTLIDVATGARRWTGAPTAGDASCAFSSTRIACAATKWATNSPVITIYDAATGRTTFTAPLSGWHAGSVQNAGNGWLVETFVRHISKSAYTLFNLDGTIRWTRSGVRGAYVRLASGLVTFIEESSAGPDGDVHSVVRLSDGRRIAGPGTRLQALPGGFARGGDRVRLFDAAGTSRGTLPTGWNLTAGTWAGWPQALPPRDCPDLIGERRKSGRHTDVGVFDAASGSLRLQRPYTGARDPKCVEGGVLMLSEARDGYTRVEVFDRLTDRTRFATEIKFVAGSPSAEAQSGTVLFLESLRFNRGQADGLTVFGYGIDRDTGTTLWRTTDDVGTAGGYLFAAGPQRTYVSLIDTRRQREDV
ncbi:hypothetical protein M2359_002132 [Gordonia amarae]|uniref:Pyrrolo-quinoline quinone repeat domain-containing protein n=2 Tax=Gordonia amarae TaxID=36821 RepID=G7GMQ3_9ACTN|nr:PQQ-binding-like beta-propeller repeat protein [Gordonia amarae]MCS3878503.1 hypothetical protein [Gordonia amarae]GAB04878.1 hypothetical protein GOAMR_24_00010 [Gordonia amarae NBRC 15530]